MCNGAVFGVKKEIPAETTKKPPLRRGGAGMQLPGSQPTSARGTACCCLTRRWAWSRAVGNDASLLPCDFFSIELMETLFRKKQLGGHISDSSRNDHTA